MTTWQKHRDLVAALRSNDRKIEDFAGELLRSLSSGDIAALAGQAYLSRGDDWIRLRNAPLPRAVWVERKAMFSASPLGRGGKPIVFALDMTTGKFTNPNSPSIDLADVEGGPESVLECFDLHFRRSDLERVFPDIFDGSPNLHGAQHSRGEGATIPKGGAPTDAEKWRNLVAITAAVIQNGAYGVEKPVPLELRKDIERYAALVGLAIGSPNTIKPAINLAIELAWRAHDGNGRPCFGADGIEL